jgi:GrxC family glutaredoxin
MITIYTKDYCPYCIKAKHLLDSLGKEYTEVDITKDPDTFMKIYAKSHLRTVPQIFVDEVCLWGYDAISELHERGELLAKL